MMRHGLFDGDMAVVLVWQDNLKPTKTREGIIMAQSLRQYGSVEHAIWIPTDGSTSCTECETTDTRRTI